MNSSRPPPNPWDCWTWLLVAIMVLALVVARNICRIPHLLDYPNERSHPQWKLSKNLCLRLSLTTETRA